MTDRRTERRALLPGLRWSGKLTIVSRHPGGAIVDFDAFDKLGGWVADRAHITESQLIDWTGRGL